MVAYFGLAIYWSCFHTKRRDVTLFCFIGVGQTGGGLARNLIRAGKEVLVYDLNPEAVKNVRSWQRGWVRQRGLHLQNVRMDLGKEVMAS
jgi:6-phosphogluconate dehydrogenase (decarboxylating)